MRLRTIPFPEDLLERVGRLAERDERTVPAEVRWLLARAVERAENEPTHSAPHALTSRREAEQVAAG